MANIDDINIRLLDATLILVFLGLMEHRKATQVALDMGLTQPAISHALKRLRSIYEDELFIRKPHGLEPTAIARMLEPRLRNALNILRATLNPSESFDPEQAGLSLRIAAFDYELATILPGLISDPALSRGNIRVTTLPVSSDEALDGLINGSIDYAVGFVEALDRRGPNAPFISDWLYDETYVVVARKDHPIFEIPLTLESYTSALHVFVAARPNVKGIVDYALDLQGLSRRVVATVPHFFPALEILSRSSFLATVPKRLAQNYAERFGLQQRELPITMPRLPVRAVRHVRDANNPVHEWLLNRLRSC